MEKRQSVDQRRVRALAVLSEEAETLRRQGSVQSSWRYKNGRRLGPFFRLVYRQRGRECTVYLGRNRALAEEVRAALSALQTPLRRQRQVDRQLVELQKAIKEQKHLFDQELRRRGLYRKGNEIRGWRGLTQCPGPQEPDSHGMGKTRPKG